MEAEERSASIIWMLRMTGKASEEGVSRRE